MSRSVILTTLAAVGFLAPAAVSAQEVYRNVSSEKLEALLGELNITYKKTQSTAKDKDGNLKNIFFYDFDRNGFKIRLHNYEGKDLWIDALFSDKLTPEQVNRWNIRAKFSRAVIIKDMNQNKETVSIESQIDCLGGVSDNIVKQFINRFDGELTEFRNFIVGPPR